jgi:multiple RNA-binding domain-containing protein 1
MSRLFLKDLPKWIGNEELFSKFINYGKITDIKIIQRRGRNLGFVGFRDKNCALKIIKKYKFFFFENNKILLNVATRKKVHVSSEDEINSKSFLGESVIKSVQNFFPEETCEMGKIFVRNLPRGATENDINHLLKPFGLINKIYVLNHDMNYKSSQALVEYGIPECASRAAACLDGKIFRGKIIHILPFDKKKYISKERKEKCTKFNNFRRIKNLSKIENSFNSRSHFNLFVPREKLIRSLNVKYNVGNKGFDFLSKSKIDSNDIVFNEARIQNELALMLKYTGINDKAFGIEKNNQKSKRTFFIKSDRIARISVIKKTLEKFGRIVKFLYFSFTNFVLVEFQKKQNAEYAFDFLEKFRTKKKSFLIEWAPLGCIINSLSNYDPKKSRNNIKNSKLVFYKSDRKFIESKEKKKLITRQHLISDFNNRKKEFQFSYLEKKENTAKENSHKILVRNLPFHINIVHLKKIFQNYGTLLSIRMPKKFSGQFKGFAFIEYKSLEDAKKAVLSTQSIHLFSRHLVVSLFSK